MNKKSLETALIKLRKDYKKQSAKLLDKAKSDLTVKLRKLRDFVHRDFRHELYSDASVRAVLKSLGLAPVANGSTKAKAGRKKVKSKKRTTDEQILAFLSSERTTGEVQAHFGLSSVTVGKRLKELYDAKKVKMDKAGVKKIWKRA